MVHSTTREVSRETHLIFVGNEAFRGATAQSTMGTIMGCVALVKEKGGLRTLISFCRHCQD